jgi:integrating conjugative element membrane protein (TIGR03745 family)
MSAIKRLTALPRQTMSFASASVRRALTVVSGALALLITSHPAMAALPGTVTPGAGVNGGDYIALLQQYWKSGVAVLVLMVGSYAFVEVSGGAIAKFREWREGKAELGDLKWFFFIGVVMLVAVVYLLTTANGIL